MYGVECDIGWVSWWCSEVLLNTCVVCTSFASLLPLRMCRSLPVLIRDLSCNEPPPPPYHSTHGQILRLAHVKGVPRRHCGPRRNWPVWEEETLAVRAGAAGSKRFTFWILYQWKVHVEEWRILCNLSCFSVVSILNVSYILLLFISFLNCLSTNLS